MGFEKPKKGELEEKQISPSDKLVLGERTIGGSTEIKEKEKRVNELIRELINLSEPFIEVEIPNKGKSGNVESTKHILRSIPGSSPLIMAETQKYLDGDEVPTGIVSSERHESSVPNDEGKSMFYSPEAKEKFIEGLEAIVKKLRQQG